MSIPTNKYPYTDLHELNADYLLQEIGTEKNAITELDTRVTALEEGGGGGSTPSEWTLIKSFSVSPSAEPKAKSVLTADGNLPYYDDITNEVIQYLDEKNVDIAQIIAIPRKPSGYLLNITDAIPSPIMIISRINGAYSFGNYGISVLSRRGAFIEYDGGGSVYFRFYSFDFENNLLEVEMTGSDYAIFDVYIM